MTLMMQETEVQKETLPHPWLRIKPSFPLLEKDPLQEKYFLHVVQTLLESILPEDLWMELQEVSPIRIHDDPILQNSMWYYRLMKSLPLFQFSSREEAPCSLPVTFLCPSDFTSGVGRYVVDTLTRWLIPGKHLNIVGSLSLNFQFENCSTQRFHIGKAIVGIHTKEELEVIRNSLPSLIQEMKVNIMAVYHARYIASLRSISLEQKNKLIQENLTSILNLPSNENNRSLYDHMQNFLLKLSEEEKIGEVKKNIAYLRNCRPKAFDRDVFYEMTLFTALFRDQFSSKRDSRHISRVIALHYLFKKVLLESAQKNPEDRHLSIKVFKTCLETSEQVLGILVGMNLVRDSDRLERRQFIDAIRNVLPETAYIQDSFIPDRRDDKVHFFYIEIGKSQKGAFQKEEISLLRKGLPEEIKKQIENAVHPIFMPRNEEELLRNLIDLCKQLKYTRDLPQISIHYEKQTNSDLSFTVLLARLKVKKQTSLKDCFSKVSTPLNFMIDEIRVLGTLKKKYPKEAAIIRVTLRKSLFFRQDHSVDLLRARQKVVLELNRILGEFRDYNGGMILKQDESLDLLRKEVGSTTEDEEFFLENYFYSLRPGIMQTVHDPAILKKHFYLFTDLIKNEPTEGSFTMKKGHEGKFFIYFIGAMAPTFKEYVENAIEKLKIPSYDLTTSFLQVHETCTLGYILRAENPCDAAAFEAVLLESLQTWSDQFSCPISLTRAHGI